jgi:undecaprenyl-diphosphatase
MTYLQAIFLGLLQGLTEFLPVSSSGHLVLAQSLLPGFHQPGVLFDALLHAGTMGAVLIYFRAEIGRLLLCPFRREAEFRVERRTLWLILAASVPTALIGLGFQDFLEGLFHRPVAVAGMLLVTGCLLFFTEGRKVGSRTEADMSLVDALAVGLAQGAAIIPGISRSGSTIACLLLRGVAPTTAARFSFLLAVPAVMGASLLQLRHGAVVPSGQWPVYAAGMVAAFASGWLAIDLLMNALRRRRLRWFAVYCWLAGGLYLAWSFWS